MSLLLLRFHQDDEKKSLPFFLRKKNKGGKWEVGPGSVGALEELLP